MKAIYCQNIRYKYNKITGEHDRKICNCIIGFVWDTKDQRIPGMKCKSCNCFYNFELKNGKATLTLIDTKQLNFDDKLEVTQIGYQTKG